MDLADSGAPLPITGVHWSNYGHSRLYISQGAEKLAWADLKTGSVQITSDTGEDIVHAFIESWTREAAIEWPPTPPADVVSEASAEPQSATRTGAVEPPRPENEDLQEGIATPAAPQVGTDAAEARDLAHNKAGEAAQAVADELLIGVSRFRRFLHALFNVHTDARAWAKGAEGERIVAAQLDKLGPEWRTLHAVNVGTRGSDIDHVLIGPAGVITVNSKNHSGRKVWVRGSGFLVDGSRQPYIRNSRHESDRAARLLAAACGFEVPTTALIAVVVSASDLDIKAQPDEGVRVAHYKAVRRWIARLPIALTPAQIDAVYSAARTSTTWT
ncbi:MAG TPA: nuclease-related domain-containing protein [Arthrobacter sp.]